jgi:CheY-like chemotaxis protein
VEVIKTQKLDLILMDVQMPLMTGIEATQSIANLILKELKIDQLLY